MPYFGSRGSISKIAMPDFGSAAPYHTLTLKCVNFVNFVNFLWKIYCIVCTLRVAAAVFRRVNPTAFAMGFSYFFSAEFIRHFRGPRKSLIFGERKNDGALISIHRNPLAKSLLTRGILRSPFWRRLCFGRVVRLLQRAEEGCEGLKHGYYDLPCVHFLIFLCHDIKNKIDRLFFIFMNKIFQD